MRDLPSPPVDDTAVRRLEQLAATRRRRRRLRQRARARDQKHSEDDDDDVLPPGFVWLFDYAPRTALNL